MEQSLEKGDARTMTVPVVHGPEIPVASAPSLFVDALEGFYYNEHVVKINAIEHVPMRDPAGNMVPVARTALHLVFTHTVVEQIYQYLGE